MLFNKLAKKLDICTNACKTSTDVCTLRKISGLNTLNCRPDSTF